RRLLFVRAGRLSWLILWDDGLTQSARQKLQSTCQDFTDNSGPCWPDGRDQVSAAGVTATAEAAPDGTYRSLRTAQAFTAGARGPRDLVIASWWYTTCSPKAVTVREGISARSRVASPGVNRPPWFQPLGSRRTEGERHAASVPRPRAGSPGPGAVRRHSRARRGQDPRGQGGQGR